MVHLVLSDGYVLVHVVFVVANPDELLPFNRGSRFFMPVPVLDSLSGLVLLPTV